MAVKAIFGTGPGELSLLFTLFYLHAGGGLTNLARTTGGAQEGRFDGGSQQLAEGMAAELGGRVMLGAPVETIAHGSDHVAVGARLVAPGADPADPAAGHRPLRVRARRAVLAMSPALCGRLTYVPALPGRRDQLCQRMPMGAVTKVHVLYDEPFWRDEGLNGQIVAPGGVMESTFDNSPEDGSHGAIVGFIAGDDCRRMEAAGPETRRGAVLADLVRAFGPAGAHARRDRRAALAGRALHPRRPRRGERPRRAHRPGARPPHAGRPAALGRHGDGDHLVRLPRRARSRRGSAPPTRCCTR